MIFIVLLSGPSHSAIVHNPFLVPIGAGFCFIFYFQQTDYKLYKLAVWRNGEFLAEIMRCWTQCGGQGPPLASCQTQFDNLNDYKNKRLSTFAVISISMSNICLEKVLPQICQNVTFLFILSFILKSLFSHAWTMNWVKRCLKIKAKYNG